MTQNWHVLHQYVRKGKSLNVPTNPLGQCFLTVTHLRVNLPSTNEAESTLKCCISSSECVHCVLFLYLVLLLDSSGFHSSVWLLVWGQSHSCGPWLPAPLPGNTWLLEPGHHSHRSYCTGEMGGQNFSFLSIYYWWSDSWTKNTRFIWH